MERKPYRIGCGAGFAGDRLDAALPVVMTLAKYGGPSAIVFETLAERTLAAAQLARRTGGIGYDPLLEPRLEPILGPCLRHGIPIVGNFGAADPEGAARTIALMAERMIWHETSDVEVLYPAALLVSSMQAQAVTEPFEFRATPGPLHGSGPFPMMGVGNPHAPAKGN